MQKTKQINLKKTIDDSIKNAKAQQTTFFDKAKKVIEKNQDMLTVFEEFDRTGKFRKRTYKTRPSFTIDEDLFNRYRNYCKKNGISMSAKIENFIKTELEKE